MKKTMEYGYAVKVQDGSIYTWGGSIIENPALIISTAVSGGTLISWGDRPYVEKKYKDIVDKYRSVGCPTDDLILITLDNPGMSRAEQCYILRRCIEYTASGFHSKLYDMLLNGNDPLGWLREEMQRVPIEVEG